LAGAIEFYSSGFHGGEDVSINNAVLLDSDIDILSLNIVRCNPEGFAAPGWNSFPNSSLPAQVLDPERDSGGASSKKSWTAFLPQLRFAADRRLKNHSTAKAGGHAVD
jgi:hypothetical protein